MINELGWKKIRFLGHNPAEMLEGYVFTVDGKNLEFDSFQPLGWYDIDFEALLNSVTFDECPPVAWCSCGCIYCDSVRALVEFATDTVSWSVFHYSIDDGWGTYTFAKEQYLQAIKSLAKVVEEEHHG